MRISFKNIFFISISFAVLFSCSIGGFYVWRSEQLIKEAASVEKARKRRLIKHYAFGLNFYYKDKFYALKRGDYLTISICHKEIEKIENQMYQDGFDRDEILRVCSKCSI